MYATVLPGNQYVQVAGVPMDPPKNGIILNERKQWWWEPGPVDSCCFCCHLEGGIMVLAGLKTVGNAILLLLIDFLINAEQNETENALETAQEQYTTGCKSNSPTLSYEDCRQLEQNIDELQNSLSEQQEHMSGAVSLYGYFTIFCAVVGLAGGVAGLWASCGRNTFAAKLFFWSWPASIALRIVLSIVKITVFYRFNRHGPSALGSIPLVFTLFFYIYFMKVSWSYYTVLKTRDTNASSSFESSIELRGINE